jgi:FkbM family methyltransferase
MAKKIALAIRMARKPVIEVGGISYRMRSCVMNPLWLDEARTEHEPWLDDVLRAAFRCRDGAFIDVGANIGRMMLKVLAIDDTRQYVGFEPQVTCSAILQTFIRENGLNKHTILPIGLATGNTTVELLVSGEDFDPTASMVQSFRPDGFYREHQYVCVRNGDEVVAELDLRAIAVIKIDVEGAELEVIEGLSNTLRKQQPFVVFEVLNFYLLATNQPLPEQTVKFRQNRIERLEHLLRSFGYGIFRIVPGGPQAVRKIQPESTPDLRLANYIAVPRDSQERFLKQFPTYSGTA